MHDALLSLADHFSQRKERKKVIQEVAKPVQQSYYEKRAFWLADELKEFSEENWLGFNHEVNGLLYKYHKAKLQRERPRPETPTSVPSRPTSAQPTCTPTQSMPPYRSQYSSSPFFPSQT